MLPVPVTSDAPLCEWQSPVTSTPQLDVARTLVRMLVKLGSIPVGHTAKPASGAAGLDGEPSLQAAVDTAAAIAATPAANAATLPSAIIPCLRRPSGATRQGYNARACLRRPDPLSRAESAVVALARILTIW